VIVFDDADLDRALDAVVFMIYSLNGRALHCRAGCWCSTASRTNSSKAHGAGEGAEVGHPLDP